MHVTMYQRTAGESFSIIRRLGEEGEGGGKASTFQLCVGQRRKRTDIFKQEVLSQPAPTAHAMMLIGSARRKPSDDSSLNRCKRKGDRCQVQTPRLADRFCHWHRLRLPELESMLVEAPESLSLL